MGGNLGRTARYGWLAGSIAVLLLCTAHVPPRLHARANFASLVAELSETPGYFDTDNLISNERSYLQVVSALRERRDSGGTYIGVGPDQNFTYIAVTRPSLAIIVDVRRDNLLLHLLFKAIFEVAGTRVEYLSLLFGRAPPAHPDEWRKASIDQLAAHVDGSVTARPSIDAVRARVDEVLVGFGVPLSREDRHTIDRFHRTFIEEGLSLKFRSLGRSPRPYYPTYRDLLLERDSEGRQTNFLSSEEDFQFVRSLQTGDQVIPVVGDVSGRAAMSAIGRHMTTRGERLATFYTSNVESYLLRDGSFPRFVENLKSLPRANNSVIVRALFGGRWAPAWGDSQRPYYSSSVVQPVNDLLEDFSSGGLTSEWDLTQSSSPGRQPR